MKELYYYDRASKRVLEEKIYGRNALKFMYGAGLATKLFSPVILPLVAGHPAFSAFYGKLQKTKRSAKKIKPFINDYQVDAGEFLLKTDEFKSFNDFFIRKLKPEARPIHSDKNSLIIPADGRFRFYQNINTADLFDVKGQRLNLDSLLMDEELTRRYQNGSMMIARLCPSDYHRFHFPCDCVPLKSRLINGYLYSVNPVAIKRNINIYSQNKRSITTLRTELFGDIAYLEIGATNVGTIHQTYTPNKPYKKGDEKGYFSFGGSALILLWEPGKIQFDADLLEIMSQGLEIRCLLGQSMGKSK